jgi:hypothetical protein
MLATTEEDSDARRRLVNEWSDMVVRTDEGDHVPCSVVTMILNSPMFFQLLTGEVEPEKDVHGRVVMPFPGVPSHELRLALNAVHGITWGLFDNPDVLPSVIRGCDALGFDAAKSASVVRLWTLRATAAAAAARPMAWVPDIKLGLDDFVRQGSIRDAVVRSTVREFVTWDRYSFVVLPEIKMDPDVATYLAGALSAFFPAGLVCVRLLDLMRSMYPGSTTRAVATRVLDESGATHRMHPREWRDVCGALEGLDRQASAAAAAGTGPEREKGEPAGGGARPEFPFAGTEHFTSHLTFETDRRNGAHTASMMTSVFPPARAIVPLPGRWGRYAMMDTGAVCVDLMPNALPGTCYAPNVPVPLTVRTSVYGERGEFAEEVRVVRCVPMGVVPIGDRWVSAAGTPKTSFEALMTSPARSHWRLDICYFMNSPAPQSRDPAKSSM